MTDLTQKELEVLELVTQGLTYQTIGRRLGKSPKTVEHLSRNLQKKLGTHHVAHAVAVAFRKGLIT